MTEMMRGVGHRRDVGDDQALDRGAVFECGGHRHLAAHAVPEQRKAVVAALLQCRPYVFGHFAVIHRLGPGRGAMVAQIEGDDVMMRRKALRNRRPVPAGAEQPMQDRQRRPRAIFDSR